VVGAPFEGSNAAGVTEIRPTTVPSELVRLTSSFVVEPTGSRRPTSRLLTRDLLISSALVSPSQARRWGSAPILKTAMPPAQTVTRPTIAPLNLVQFTSSLELERTGFNRPILKLPTPEVRTNLALQWQFGGDTLVVGAPGEDGNATGVNGNQTNNRATDSGAAYVFVRNGSNWTSKPTSKLRIPGRMITWRVSGNLR